MKACSVINLQPHAEGWLLLVRAIPGARADACRGVHDGELRLAVTQIAEKGKANRAIRDLLVRSLNLRRSEVELVAGETSPHKTFLIRGLDRETLLARIASAGKRAGPVG